MILSSVSEVNGYGVLSVLQNVDSIVVCIVVCVVVSIESIESVVVCGIGWT